MNIKDILNQHAQKTSFKDSLVKFLTGRKKETAYANDNTESRITTLVAQGLLEGGQADAHSDFGRTVFSQEIVQNALPLMVYHQFAHEHTELMREAGESITVTKMNNIKRGGRLDEGVRIKTKSMSTDKKQITVYEYGNAVAYTEFVKQTTFLEMFVQAIIQLGRDYAMVVETEYRDAIAKGFSTKLFGRENHKQAKINLRTEITEDNPFSTTVVKDGVETLTTKNVPKFEGNYYVCVVHAHQARQIRDDQHWVNAVNYASPENILTGEIGRYENVRFVETTLVPNGVEANEDGYVEELKPVGEAPAIFQATMFGERAYAMATSVPVEFREGSVVDFGREHGVAWYGIFGIDVLNEERGVLIETC